MPHAHSHDVNPDFAARIRERAQRIRQDVASGLLPIFFHPDYTCGAHGFDTTRKAAWVAESLAANPIPPVAIVAPAPLTELELDVAHDRAYIDAVRTGAPSSLAASQGFRWDPALWTMVTRSNGGAVDAALAALAVGVSGSLSSGLHHARRDIGRGFCTLNGLAVAAYAALAAGAQRILILDFDAHCGGGTASIITGDDRIVQVDVATDVFDRYTTARELLTVVNRASEYLSTIEHALATATRLGPFDLCIYNAGMDPHEHCEIGGLSGVTAAMLQTREEAVFTWCATHRLPVAFVLAGGYINGPRLHRDDLVALHRLTIAAATRCVR